MKSPEELLVEASLNKIYLVKTEHKNYDLIDIDVAIKAIRIAQENAIDETVDCVLSFALKEKLNENTLLKAKNLMKMEIHHSIKEKLSCIFQKVKNNANG